MKNATEPRGSLPSVGAAGRRLIKGCGESVVTCEGAARGWGMAGDTGTGGRGGGVPPGTCISIRIGGCGRRYNYIAVER